MGEEGEEEEEGEGEWERKEGEGEEGLHSPCFIRKSPHIQRVVSWYMVSEE